MLLLLRVKKETNRIRGQSWITHHTTESQEQRKNNQYVFIASSRKKISSFSCFQLYHPPEGPSPWAPALASDGVHPTLLSARPPPGHQGGEGNTAKKTTRFDPGGEGIGKEHGMREVVRPIRAVETGIVDVCLQLAENCLIPNLTLPLRRRSTWWYRRRRKSSAGYA